MSTEHATHWNGILSIASPPEHLRAAADEYEEDVRMMRMFDPQDPRIPGRLRDAAEFRRQAAQKEEGGAA
jgi:hypothetical protein